MRVSHCMVLQLAENSDVEFLVENGPWKILAAKAIGNAGTVDITVDTVSILVAPVVIDGGDMTDLGVETKHVPNGSTVNVTLTGIDNYATVTIHYSAPMA